MKVNWPERLWCNSPLRAWCLKAEGRALAAMRPMAPGGTCLEIGCGNGVGSRVIRAKFAPGRYWGLDIDPAMLDKARRRGPGGALAAFMLGDAQDLPFPDQVMDAVFNFGIVHHLEDWRRGIAQVARVLKPGGAFYFEEIYPPLYANAVLGRVVAHPREDRFAGEEFKNQLAACGLRLLPGHRESRFGILGVAKRRDNGS